MIGTFIFLLGIVGLAVLWCFFSFQPRYVNERLLKAFNWTVVGMCVMFCLGLCAYIYSDMSPESRGEYFFLFALGGCLGVEIVFFSVGLLLRNFWIFAPPRRRGHSLFD